MCGWRKVQPSLPVSLKSPLPAAFYGFGSDTIVSHGSATTSTTLPWRLQLT